MRRPVARPLLLSSDPLASLGALGADVRRPAPLGRLLREDPRRIEGLYERQIAAGVDVLCAVTSATTPRALAPTGMAFRAAALTGAAVELAVEAAGAAPRRVAVAGLLGHTAAAPVAERIAEDYGTHAARLSAAGCEILVAAGFGPSQAATVGPGLARAARRAAVVSACATQLATWALVELDAGARTPDGDRVEDVARAAIEDGADALLFEVPSPDVGLAALQRLAWAAEDVQVGLLLPASPDPDVTLETWVAAAARLIDAGACILGGGAGTTADHVGALSKTLRSLQRQPRLRRAL